METLFLLGSHPKLSIAELIRVLGEDLRILAQTDQALFADLPSNMDLESLQMTLGGTVKIAQPLMESKSMPTSTAIMEHIEPDGEGKWQFGFSLYGAQAKKNKQWQRVGIDMKKAWRDAGFSTRFVTTKDPILSSIVVHKEGMLDRGADICVLEHNGSLILAKTAATQDPREFAKRDYGKAKRPTRVGMLPIKLAKIMINLAAASADATILDPFMGSGTVLTELLVAGRDPKYLVGSDKAKRALDHTRENLEAAHLPLPTLTSLDARELHTQHKAGSVDAIITEGHLGLPKTDADRMRYKKEMEALYADVIASFGKITKPHGVVVMAFPSYKMDNGTILYLNLSKAIAKAGFRIHKFTHPDLQTERDTLIYGRPTARVLREIYILHKN